MAGNVTAERVQAGMDALGIDQSELARRVGCTSAAINQIVRGHTRQSRFLPAIAREIGLPFAYVTGETDEPDADLPDDALTAEERESLEQLRQLPAKDRQAVLQLLRSLTDAQEKPTVHAPAQEYRARSIG